MHPKRQDIDLNAALAPFGRSGTGAIAMEAGNTNWSWRLADDTLFTVFVDSDTAATARLVGMLQHFEAHGLTTNRVVPTSAGAPLGDVLGLPTMLKSWMPGHTLIQPRPDELVALGREVATLHSIPPVKGLPCDHLFGIPEAATVVGSGLDDGFEGALDAALKRLLPVMSSELPRGLIHGDLFGDNIVQQGDKVSIIDFEEASLSPLVADLGMALVGVCSPGAVADADLGTALLRGYIGGRSLSEAEWDALPDVTALAAWSCASWRFWRYHISRPIPERAQLHLEMVRLAKAWPSSVRSIRTQLATKRLAGPGDLKRPLDEPCVEDHAGHAQQAHNEKPSKVHVEGTRRPGAHRVGQGGQRADGDPESAVLAHDEVCAASAGGQDVLKART